MLVRKEIGPEINAEKTKHMFMSRHQITEQIHYIKLANVKVKK
jgi:hypothetical protein